MSLRFLNPTNSGSRNTVLISCSRGEITRQWREKRLLRKCARTCGTRGIIVCRGRKIGLTRLYRKIDFTRKKIYEIGNVHAIEYDPNRNSNIALIYYTGGEKSYILAPAYIRIGARIVAGFRVPRKIGNTLPIWNIAIGTNVHNVVVRPGSKAKYSRSRGTFAQIVSRTHNIISVRLPSGKIQFISYLGWATIGHVGNFEVRKTIKGKAGRIRWIGCRPSVRGRSINPVDHPHGGGEGRSPIGKIRPFTPWGKPRLGLKTAKLKKYNGIFIR